MAPATHYSLSLEDVTVSSTLETADSGPWPKAVQRLLTNQLINTVNELAYRLLDGFDCSKQYPDDNHRYRETTVANDSLAFKLSMKVDCPRSGDLIDHLPHFNCANEWIKEAFDLMEELLKLKLPEPVIT